MGISATHPTWSWWDILAGACENDIIVSKGTKVASQRVKFYSRPVSKQKRPYFALDKMKLLSHIKWIMLEFFFSLCCGSKMDRKVFHELSHKALILIFGCCRWWIWVMAAILWKCCSSQEKDASNLQYDHSQPFWNLMELSFLWPWSQKLNIFYFQELQYCSRWLWYWYIHHKRNTQPYFCKINTKFL